MENMNNEEIKARAFLIGYLENFPIINEIKKAGLYEHLTDLIIKQLNKFESITGKALITETIQTNESFLLMAIIEDITEQIELFKFRTGKKPGKALRLIFEPHEIQFTPEHLIYHTDQSPEIILISPADTIVKTVFLKFELAIIEGTEQAERLKAELNEIQTAVKAQNRLYFRRDVFRIANKDFEAKIKDLKIPAILKQAFESHPEKEAHRAEFCPEDEAILKDFSRYRNKVR